MRAILWISLCALGGCTGASAQEGIPGTVRMKVLELTDDNGRVRASIKVEPDGQVVLRLTDQDGTLRVKLGADRDGSGLVLNNDATEPGIHALATSAGTSLRLKNKDGTEHTVVP